MILFILSILTVLLSFSIFLAKELLKKFRFWKGFQKNYKNQVFWIYDGDKNPGMYTIELRSTETFRTLIGFDLTLGPFTYLGYDVFGYMESDIDNTILFSAYLGKGGVELIFLIDGTDAKNISITCLDTPSIHSPRYVYKPHWYQRIGFYG